jgi:hypothetical protein
VSNILAFAVFVCAIVLSWAAEFVSNIHAIAVFVCTIVLVFAAEFFRVAFAVSWVFTKVIAIAITAFFFAITDTEFWVSVPVLARTAFLERVARSAIVVLIIKFLVTTLFDWIARRAMRVSSPGLFGTTG